MKKALLLVTVVIVAVFTTTGVWAYGFLAAVENGEWFDYATREPLNTELKNLSPRQLMLENGSIHVDASPGLSGPVGFYSASKFNEVNLAFAFKCLRRNESSVQLFRIDVFAENQKEPDWGGGEQFVEVFFELHKIPKIVVTSKPHERSLVSDIDINIADGKEHTIGLKATSNESGTAWFTIHIDGVAVFDHEVKQVNPEGGIMFVFSRGWGLREFVLTPLDVDVLAQ